MRKKAVAQLQESRFDLLEEVKTVNIGNEMIYGDQIAVVPFRIDHITVFRHLLKRDLAEFCHIFAALVFQFILGLPRRNADVGTLG